VTVICFRQEQITGRSESKKCAYSSNLQFYDTFLAHVSLLACGSSSGGFDGHTRSDPYRSDPARSAFPQRDGRGIAHTDYTNSSGHGSALPYKAKRRSVIAPSYLPVQAVSPAFVNVKRNVSEAAYSRCAHEAVHARENGRAPMEHILAQFVLLQYLHRLGRDRNRPISAKCPSLRDRYRLTAVF